MQFVLCFNFDYAIFPTFPTFHYITFHYIPHFLPIFYDLSEFYMCSGVKNYCFFHGAIVVFVRCFPRSKCEF